MILADTDVLIDYLAGIQPVAGQVLEYSQADSLQTSIITSIELLSGVWPGKKGDKVRRLVDAIPVLPLDREAAARAAVVRQRLARNGFPIGMADSLIARVALVNGLPLLTRNRKHFEPVEDLKLVSIE